MSTLRLTLALVVPLCWTAALQARPPYKKALADHFGPFLSKGLNDCRLCHVPEKPGAQEEGEKEHNDFGARLKAVKKELMRAGKATDIVARVEAIADEDADQDGTKNLLEILAGHNPGEAADKPKADAVAKAGQTLQAYRARVIYPWRPLEVVKRPAVPAVKNAGWVRNPIDAFIAAEHEQRNLKPRPEAPRHILVRRVYLDLVGLPPTRAELDAALNDASPEWYEKVVDQLLASPQYGERWGRHWMDVWRYSDWAGYGMEIRDSQRHIWRWRDWIVESLNQDKGYDRMVLEMLAGDELAPDDPDTLRATGFLVRNWNRYNRHGWMENMVEHTSKAFLGMTVNCAKCHDHFFDPITQEEFYRFRAFFEPYDVRTDRVPGEADVNKDGLPRAFDAKPDAVTHLFIRGNDQTPDKDKKIIPGVPAVFGGSPLQIEPVKLPASAVSPDKRDFVIQESRDAAAAVVVKAKATRDAARPTVVVAIAALCANEPLAVAPAARLQRALDGQALAELDVQVAEARQQSLDTTLQAERLEDAGQKNNEAWKQAATAANVAQRQAALLEARRNLHALRVPAPLAKGQAAPKAADLEKALAKAEQDAVAAPSTNYTPRKLTTFPTTSTGRRLGLARWIADRQNPLTARVAVNHIWLRHFGSALVPSVFDFGQNGQAATHPALMDWLAAELMDDSFSREPKASAPPSAGWSTKRLHRLMVLSATYRMDSQTDAASAALDTDNVYHWRANVRRMEAEAVRDSVLHVAGQLDLTRGGPDLDHQQGLTVRRRSLYFRHAHEKQMEFLKIFDAANVNECYRRNESVAPQQALALANSTLALAQSRQLAGQLTKTVGAEPTSVANTAFIKTAFETVLSRHASEAELAACEKFLSEQTQLLSDPKKLTTYGGGPPAPVPPATVPHQRARENLILVLMNHNDFVTIR
ncbi:MAG: DUF1549 domain-containing protein [Planctomycetia bacterium]|nr:DUF1549 domain-containing protein [Planctomycetia bacterium]